MAHTDRPDIIYICTDQQYAGAMSCAGARDVSTPNLDRLASRGVRFDSAYCTYPLCTPSRASMFAGVMPHQVGVTTNGMAIAEEFRSRELGMLLSDAGYDCAYGGKWHVPEIAMPEGHGFEVYCGFDDVGLPSRASEFLDSRNSGNPLFLVASFDNPHNICEWRRNQNIPWGEIGDPPQPEECPSLPPNFEIPPYEPEIIRTTTMDDRRLYPDDRYTPDQWRRYRWAYYRLIELVDRQIGALIDTLEAHGVLDGAVVVFTSDHGDAHAAHRLVQKTFLYDEQTRVPLIINAPDLEYPDRVVAGQVVSSGLDIYRTILDYAGVSAPAGSGGLSLRDAVRTADALVTGAGASREYIACETELVPKGGYAGRMIRTERFKYVAYEWGAFREQLFDLDADPGEMVNLAVDSSYGEVLIRHRKLLAEWCEQTNDTFYGGHYSHPDVRYMVPGGVYPQSV